MAVRLPIFSYWTEDNLDVHADLIRDWRTEFPNFRIFGDKHVLPLLQRYFPDCVEVYNDIRIPTAKSDIALLLLLYEHGGLYIDCHCGIRDADEIRALLEALYGYDAIFVDRKLKQEARPFDEHLLINSIAFCRPRAELVFRACQQALVNFARQRVSEYQHGFVPYDIWTLSGPGLLTATVLEPASLNRDVRLPYNGRVKIIREEVAPIARDRYRGYSKLGQHWSKRQQVERLFGRVAKASKVGLSDQDFERAVAIAKHPDVLRQLMDGSRRAFGVPIRHYPHTINYPWAASCLEPLAAGSRILDIGAGASPLPLYLAEKGMFVDCVDNDNVRRTLPAGDDWNEWGFFDYASLHQNLTAHNCAIEDFKPWHRYDAIYSVGTVAHMPSSIREQTLRHCSMWLKPGGRLALAIDLIPRTDTLWNRGGSEETPAEHGTYLDMERQLRSLGFAIMESRIERSIEKWSRTDLYFLAAQKG